jgi:SAM-dependent methyltransferase
MEFNQLRQQWEEEERGAQIHGWDFSHLDGRWDVQATEWKYEDIVMRYLKKSDRLLDMDTGGGEILLRFGHPYEQTSVTEGYAPNVELCRQKLSPLGIDVHCVTDYGTLPFENESFDIVINRHGSYDVSEVRRVLREGGIFITEQIGEQNGNAFSERLIDDYSSSFAGWNLDNCSNALKDAGFHIDTACENFPAMRFFDVGALVWYAKIIEWEYPGFSVDTCFDKLCEAEKEIQQTGEIAGNAHLFMIVAVSQSPSDQSPE